MEDDDLKVRRNLVLMSALVLVFAWLGIPFSVVIGKLIAPTSVYPDEHKVWLIGLVSLAYLGLRYSFSNEGVKASRDLQDEVKRMLVSKAIAMAQRQAKYLVRTGKEPSVFAGKLTEYVSERFKEHGSGGGLRLPTSIELSMYEYNLAPWDFYMNVALTWSSECRPQAASFGENPIEVKIFGFSRFLINVWARVHVFFYSESSIRYLAPALLGIAATFVLIGKILAAYINA